MYVGTAVMLLRILLRIVFFMNETSFFDTAKHDGIESLVFYLLATPS